MTSSDVTSSTTRALAMPTIPNIDEDMEAPAEAAGVPLGSGQPEMPEHSEREGCEGGSEDEGDIHCNPGCCPSCEQKFGEPDKVGKLSNTEFPSLVSFQALQDSNAQQATTESKRLRRCSYKGFFLTL